MVLEGILKKMDLKFFATGQQGISPEEILRLIGKENIFFLDVRTKEECSFLRFPFAHHIPTNEIPDRLKEIPQGELIIIFCSCVVRASIVCAYLLEKGYSKVKVLVGNIEQLSAIFKPKLIYSMNVNNKKI